MGRREIGLVSSTLLLPAAAFLAVTALISDALEFTEFVFHKYTGYAATVLVLVHVYAHWPSLVAFWTGRAKQRSGTETATSRPAPEMVASSRRGLSRRALPAADGRAVVAASRGNGHHRPRRPPGSAVGRGPVPDRDLRGGQPGRGDRAGHLPLRRRRPCPRARPGRHGPRGAPDRPARPGVPRPGPGRARPRRDLPAPALAVSRTRLPLRPARGRAHRSERLPCRRSRRSRGLRRRGLLRRRG